MLRIHFTKHLDKEKEMKNNCERCQRINKELPTEIENFIIRYTIIFDTRKAYKFDIWEWNRHKTYIYISGTGVK